MQFRQPAKSRNQWKPALQRIRKDGVVNLEEYEEIICGALVAAGGLALMALMFIFGHVGNAISAAKASVPQQIQHMQFSAPAQHMAPGILNDHNSSGYMFTTAESVTSRFGHPRQF